MKKRQFIVVLITTLVSVIFLSTVWEFWLEGFISGIFFDDHEAEPLNVRLEYIISITIFVILSLIFPAIAGFKLIENDEKMQEKIKRLSEEDYLTKLYNRRKIHEIIETESKRSRRYKSAFAVLLLDIENFKNINDTYGHKAGDLILRELGRVLHENVRKSDIACRFGGEEFLLVLLDSPLQASRQHIERICTYVKELQIRYGEQLLGTMTLSAGLVEVPDNDLMTVDDLLRAADEALYAAKRAGRDRIVAFSDLPKK